MIRRCSRVRAAVREDSSGDDDRERSEVVWCDLWTSGALCFLLFRQGTGGRGTGEDQKCFETKFAANDHQKKLLFF